MDEWMNNGWIMDGSVGRQMDDGWMNGSMDGWMNKRMIL